MEYTYGKKENYEDFSSGAVIRNAKGAPNFPVRLIQEIYGRCLSYSEKKEEIILYDCCCGGGYALTVLGFLNQDSLGAIYGSDVDAEMVELAQKNLELLTESGMEERMEELQKLHQQFGKESHRQAIASAEKLKKLLTHEMKTVSFQQDATEVWREEFYPDIVITDVPYGNLVNWKEEGQLEQMVESLLSQCMEDTIFAVIMDKQQKLQMEGIQTLEKQKIGKRKFIIFKKSKGE